MENKPWTEKGTLCWHWNKKIVPLKKIKHSADRVVTSGSGWLPGDMLVYRMVYMCWIKPQCTYLTCLPGPINSYGLTCFVLFILSVWSHKVRKSPCSCQWMWKQKHTLKKKKKRQHNGAKWAYWFLFMCLCPALWSDWVQVKAWQVGAPHR